MNSVESDGRTMTHVVDVNAYEISDTKVCLEMQAPDSSHILMNSDKAELSYATLQPTWTR
jgi:hypothetical protein